MVTDDRSRHPSSDRRRFSIATPSNVASWHLAGWAFRVICIKFWWSGVAPVINLSLDSHTRYQGMELRLLRQCGVPLSGAARFAFCIVLSCKDHISCSLFLGYSSTKVEETEQRMFLDPVERVVIGDVTCHAGRGRSTLPAKQYNCFHWRCLRRT